MQQGDMGIPASASVHAEPKRVIFGKAKVVRTSFVQEGQNPGGESIPSVCWDHIESGSQLRFKQLFRFGSVSRRGHSRHLRPALSTYRNAWSIPSTQQSQPASSEPRLLTRNAFGSLG